MEFSISDTDSLDLRDFKIDRSIVDDRSNPDAIDKNAPLTFLEWLQYFVGLESEPKVLLREYKEYVLSWHKVNSTVNITDRDTVKTLYASLFRNIAVNIFTQEERRFVSNADYSDPQQVAAVVPLFVRKIKDICLYYATQRDEAKFAVYKYNIKGSSKSIEKIINDTINNSFLDPEINKLFAEEGITPDLLQQKMTIQFEDLYDVETNYFDINPSIPLSSYDPTGDRATYFNSNDYEFDPELFIDFDNSVVKEIEKYPVLLDGLGDNFSVDINFTSEDLQFLKDQDFTNLVNDLDNNNLKINHLKEALQTFSGTDFYYLSSNANAEFKYGKLFEADTFKNYLNRRFPTIQQIESDKIKSLQQIGGFFKPDKLGIQNFLSYNVQGNITTVQPNTVYVFPDPNKYGNISGLSRTSFNNPFSYFSDVTNFKNNITNSTGFGCAITDFITKFKGYQSRSESLHIDPTGISRSTDNYDFFTGSKNTTWGSDDVFKKTPSNYLPLDEKTDYLLYSVDLTQVQFKQDLFGNSFGLYKRIKKAKDPAAIRAKEIGDTVYCIELDGSVFQNASGGSWNLPVSGTINFSTSTGTFTGTEFEYQLPCIRFYPEPDFCKTNIIYKVDAVYDSLAFDTKTPLETLQSYTFIDLAYPEAYQSTGNRVVSATVPLLFKYFPTTGPDLSSFIYYDSGPFVHNGSDASPILQEKNYTKKNVYIDATLPNTSTTFSSNSGTLSADISLYQQHNVYGLLYYRSANDTKVEPVSTALDNLFTKYASGIRDEIFNKVKSFDIINNIIIIETQNYLLFEKLNYDLELEKYIPFNNEQNYISINTSNNYNHFSNIWYNEVKDTVIVAQTNLYSEASATNSRAIYFNVYEYDGTSVNKLFPATGSIPNNIGFFSLSSLSSYSADDYINFINYRRIEKPILNYGHDTGKYTLKYIGKDPSNMFYDNEFTFKLSNQLYELSGNVYKPSDMFLHSENYSNPLSSSITTTKTLAPYVTGSFTITEGRLNFN